MAAKWLPSWSKKKTVEAMQPANELVTVADIRRAEAEERGRWLAASHKIAKSTEPFCSKDIWERVKNEQPHMSDKRRFFSRIHGLLKPLVEAGLLDSWLEENPTGRLGLRFYRKREE